ncbi:MAG: hypothetical protein OIF48_09000 [Silicimonas sp.]|nr:hypothetical protein [Silicimonas sp.]
MSILAALPVLLLGIVSVWLLWPVVADPLARRLGAARGQGERDRLAERYFDRWTKELS